MEKEEEMTSQVKKSVPLSTGKKETTAMQLVIGYENGHAAIYDPVIGSQITTLIGHSNAVSAVSSQSVDDSAFSGSTDTNLIKWSLKPEVQLIELAISFSLK